MRIAHVVAFADRLNTYGGPLTVAQLQVSELRKRGHDVDLFAMSDGSIASDRDHGLFLYRAHVLSGRSFGARFSVKMLASIARLASRYDVWHLHLARDMTTMPAAALLSTLGRPFIAQTHGMVADSPGWTFRAYDALLTRLVAQRCSMRLALTEQEQRDAIWKSTPQTLLRNGIRIPAGPMPTYRQAKDATVLFISRLQVRKRPRAFVDMATHLSDHHGIRSRFRLYGPDEGEGPDVRDHIARLPSTLDINLCGPLSPDRRGEVLRGAQVLVLPSVDEPFPMVALEAMAHGVPLVLTDQTGISEELRRSDAAVVTSPDAQALAHGVLLLLTNEEAWRHYATQGRRTIEQRFSIASIVRQLEDIYRSASSRR